MAVHELFRLGMPFACASALPPRLAKLLALLAVAQAARCAHQPRRPHEQALARAGRYLKGAAGKGAVPRPAIGGGLAMGAYADAAFASGWGCELEANPDSVKSRTGFILEVAGCPILWASKLQPAIATSAMEAEHAALPVSLRSVIPLLNLARNIAKGLGFKGKRSLTFQATAHEGNQGALKLANLEGGRNAPRSKFYALRLRWLRPWLRRPLGGASASFTSTELQKADMLAKSLGPALFRANRMLSMGWQR